MFDRTALEAFFNKFGARISCIIMDNNNKIFIGYPSSTVNTVDDLSIETIGGIDLLAVPKDPSDPKARADGVQFTIYHPLDCIQAIVVSDEDHPNNLVDPFDLG